eukprot:COSAG02_NODE_998_length_15331_cov_38.406119_19_plen_464_part_01
MAEKGADPDGLVGAPDWTAAARQSTSNLPHGQERRAGTEHSTGGPRALLNPLSTSQIPVWLIDEEDKPQQSEQHWQQCSAAKYPALGLACVAVVLIVSLVGLLRVQADPESAAATVESCNADTCGLHGECIRSERCVCDEGYIGSRCKTIDLCFGVECGDHGRCDDFGRCACDLGYSGGTCQIFDPCVGTDCGEFGECRLGTCVCHPGYAGPLCSWPDCQLVSCGRHGTCAEGVCLCSRGWEGEECNLQSSAPSPPMHDGLRPRPPPPSPPPVSGAAQCSASVPTIAHGAYTVIHLFGHSEATLNCSYGYTPSSYGATITCTNNVWSQHGTCTLRGGVPPSPPPLGVLTCQATRLPYVANGHYAEENLLGRQVGNLLCNAGYRASQNGAALHCTNGHWDSSSSYTCIHDATQPLPPPGSGCTTAAPTVANGEYTVTHLFGHSEATLTCNYGYTPSSYGATISCT